MSLGFMNGHPEQTSRRRRNAEESWWVSVVVVVVACKLAVLRHMKVRLSLGQADFSVFLGVSPVSGAAGTAPHPDGHQDQGPFLPAHPCLGLSWLQSPAFPLPLKRLILFAVAPQSGLQ